MPLSQAARWHQRTGQGFLVDLSAVAQFLLLHPVLPVSRQTPGHGILREQMASDPGQRIGIVCKKQSPALGRRRCGQGAGL